MPGQLEILAKHWKHLQETGTLPTEADVKAISQFLQLTQSLFGLPLEGFHSGGYASDMKLQDNEVPCILQPGLDLPTSRKTQTGPNLQQINPPRAILQQSYDSGYDNPDSRLINVLLRRPWGDLAMPEKAMLCGFLDRQHNKPRNNLYQPE